MPLPSVWGPFLWNTLHAIGAHAGKSHEKTRIDEIRELRWLLENLESVVPCNECRIHIKEYKKGSPIPESAGEYGIWLWNFHEAVNKRLGKTADIPFTPELGASTRVRESWKQYVYILRDSVLSGHVKGSSVKDFTRRIGLWAGFAGV